MEDAPPGLLEQPLREAAVGTEPDQLDPIAVAEGIPARAAGQGVDVLDDRLLAEQLEPVVEIGSPSRPALGRDEATPILLVEQPRDGGLMGQRGKRRERP